MHITECTKCHSQFRDGPEVASVCPKCGHENNWDEDEYDYGDTYLGKVIG